MKWILRAKGLSFGHYKQQWFGKSRLKRSNRFCEVMERKIMLSMFLDAWQMKHQTGRKYVQALQFQSCDVWTTLTCVWFGGILLNSWVGSPLISVKLLPKESQIHVTCPTPDFDDLRMSFRGDEVDHTWYSWSSWRYKIYNIYIYSSLWWNWPHFVVLDTWEANYHDMDGAFRGCMMRHTDFVEMTAPLFLEP